MPPIPRGGAVLVVASALAFAAPAEAGSLGTSHGLEYIRGSTTALNTQAGPDAECDGDDMATGGGGWIRGPGADAMLHASYQPGLDGSRWVAEGSTTGTNARTVKAYAVCGPKVVDYVDAARILQPGQAFNYGDVCLSNGERAIGGGVEAQGGELQIVAMRPDLTGPFDWLTSVKNLNGSQTLDLTVLWICSDAYDVRYRSHSNEVPGGAEGRAIAECRSDEAVLGGGLVAANNSGQPQFKAWTLQSRPVDSRTDDDRTPDDGWLGRAYNGANARIMVTAYAVCRT